MYRDGERSLLAVMYCTMFSWYGTMLVASQKFFSLIPRSSASCNSLSSIVRNGILSIFLYYLLRIFPTQVNVGPTSVAVLWPWQVDRCLRPMYRCVRIMPWLQLTTETKQRKIKHL